MSVIRLVLWAVLFLCLGWLIMEPRSAAADPAAEEKADAELKRISARVNDPLIDREAIRQELLVFRRAFPGTSATVRAASLLAQLPSPLDRLDPKTIPAVERFDWQPKELVAVMGEHRGRHGSSVHSVAFSPDGNSFALGGGDMTVRVWSLRTKQEMPALQGQSLPVSFLAFYPDGQTLAVGAGESEAGMRSSHTLRLWEFAKDRKKILIKDSAGSGASCWAYDPDSKALACASMALEGGLVVPAVKLWDAATGKELKTITGLQAGSIISALAFAPDGKTLASAIWSQRDFPVQGTIQLLDIASGKEKSSLKGGHRSQIDALAYAPDGKTLAALGRDAILKIWDVSLSREINLPATDGQTLGVSCMALSRDGKMIATGSSSNRKTVMLWDSATGRIRQSLSAHTASLKSVAFSADGKTLASSSLDGQLIVWKSATGDKLHQWMLPGAAQCLLFSDDGRYLFTGNGNGTVYVLRLTK